MMFRSGDIHPQDMDVLQGEQIKTIISLEDYQGNEWEADGGQAAGTRALQARRRPHGMIAAYRIHHDHWSTKSSDAPFG